MQRGNKGRESRNCLEGKARDAWQGVKTLAGLSSNNAAPPTGGANDCVNMAESLNQFFCRFDKTDFMQERAKLTGELKTVAPAHPIQVLQQAEVELVLSRTKPNEAPGPDKISGRLLKACSNQLAGVFCHLFNLSQAEYSIPSFWNSVQ